MNRMIASLCNGIGLASLAVAALASNGCGGEAGVGDVDDPAAGEMDGKADWRSAGFRAGSGSLGGDPTIPPGRQTSDFDYSIPVDKGTLSWSTDQLPASGLVPATALVQAVGGAGIHWHGYDLSADASGLVHLQTSFGSGNSQGGFNVYPALASISARASLNGAIGADVFVSLGGGQQIFNQHLDKNVAKNFSKSFAQDFEYGSTVAIPFPDDAKDVVSGSFTLASSGRADVRIKAVATPRQVQASASAHVVANAHASATTTFHAAGDRVGPSANGDFTLLDDQIDFGAGAEFQQASDRSWDACFYLDAHNRLNGALNGSLSLSADVPVIGHKEYQLLSWPGIGADNRTLFGTSDVQMAGTHRAACGPLQWNRSVGAVTGAYSCICKPFLKP